MQPSDIIRMAREAGLHSAVLLYLYEGREAALTDSERDELRRLQDFAALVAAAEREACAKLCADYTAWGREWGQDNNHMAAEAATNECAAAIRARGQE